VNFECLLNKTSNVCFVPIIGWLGLGLQGGCGDRGVGMVVGVELVGGDAQGVDETRAN